MDFEICKKCLVNVSHASVSYHVGKVGCDICLMYGEKNWSKICCVFRSPDFDTENLKEFKNKTNNSIYREVEINFDLKKLPKFSKLIEPIDPSNIIYRYSLVNIGGNRGNTDLSCPYIMEQSIEYWNKKA